MKRNFSCEEGSKTTTKSTSFQHDNSSSSKKGSCGEVDDDDDEEEEEEVDKISSVEGGSINELENKGSGEGSVVVPSCRSVRPYSRSKMPRLRWTPQLHLCFLHAVERLGGRDRATPKLVLQLMNVKGVSIAHVKSHLQMYRSRKINDTNLEQALSLESRGHKFYCPSKFPKLHSFNPRSSSSLSYGDACNWKGHDNQICSPYNIIDSCGVNRAKHGLYGSITERVLFGRPTDNSFNGDSNLSTTISSFNNIGHSNTNKRSSTTSTHPPILLDGEVESLQRCSRKPTSIDHLIKKGSSDRNWRAIQQVENTEKQKTLDLNLSLKVKEKGLEGTSDEEVVDSDLCLSLSSSSLFTAKHAKKTKMVASPLDLTL